MGIGLLERVRREGSPLVDGSSTTFVWKGPEAPSLLGDFNGWDDSAQSLMAAIISAWLAWR